MNGTLRLPLNLATRPLQNRRLFRTIVGGLIVLFLLAGGAAAVLLVRSIGQRKADAAVSTDLELRIQAADKERADKDRLGDGLKRDNALFVAEINTAIARKNFSWVDFFSRLESALPPDCQIVEINPLELSGTAIRVAMKVATPDVSGLLKLIENLAAEKFSGISMRSETTGGGRKISEIGFVYEGSR